MDYIIEDFLILIPVLLVIGKILKNYGDFPDWMIPYALLILGTSLALAMGGLSVDSVIQGVLVTGAAVFGNQLFKQAKEGKYDYKK